MVYLTLLLRHAANYYWGLRCPERVVIDLDRRSRDARAVLSIASTMHVKAVAERFSAFDVVARYVTATRAACAGNRMTIPVEHVVLDQ